MNRSDYLARINFAGPASPDHETLMMLHRQHVYHVPFEDLDIHYQRPFTLDEDRVFDKIVNHRRGGFCYEVNSLLTMLLNDIGFSARIISARVFTEDDVEGPPFDHMAVLIELDKTYLADVGFGDLFITPLELKEDIIQTDGRNHFRIDKRDDGNFVLQMASDQKTFQRKYSFSLAPCTLDDFREPCRDKQINPESHFVKNTICTLPTEQGRITVYNARFIDRKGTEKYETLVDDDAALRKILKERFQIEILP
ncbi:arylamine N-acetyltransferase family protein [Chryseolinea lacunae]|uniref:Arylamine N-acetyltransferase n=1 Tax=Chryseolinea lacunae TaxID=2801331 RepID=A0ABS1L287_9BACT|nr:arylamine N-acetyltransferase [Chryseolinea lacunae]MBL0745057.1 arylamine N-acetyltransferase [Chryseolinea lacunae]